MALAGRTSGQSADRAPAILTHEQYGCNLFLSGDILAERIAHFIVELKAGSDHQWVHLMPAGEFRAHEFDGRAGWTLTSAEKVIEKSLSLGRDIVIDFEHQTDKAAANGQPAPAAGWIKQLEARSDGIWGRVEWTARAAEMLKNREYRYISPTFAHSKSGEVLAILRAGLTNDPALSLTALASSEYGDRENMEEFLKTLAAALGLPEDKATDVAVCAAIKSLAEQAKSGSAAVARLAEAAGLEKAAKVDDIVAAIADIAKAKAEANAADPAKYVSIDQFKTVAASLKDLQDKVNLETATATVDAAVKAGKVPPAMKEWALGYAKSDPAGFASYIENAPVLAGEFQLSAQVDTATGLTSAELAVAKAMNLTAEEFAKSKKGAAA